MSPILDPSPGRGEAGADAARRLLLKAGAYTVPAILATALTATNVYASGNQKGNDGNQKGNNNDNNNQQQGQH